MDIQDLLIIYLDAYHTVFALIALWMLANKNIEYWVVRFMVDIVYTYVCIKKGLLVISLQHIIYLFMNIFGYIKWNKDLN